jgi:hypothetical protein
MAKGSDRCGKDANEGEEGHTSTTLFRALRRHAANSEPLLIATAAGLAILNIAALAAFTRSPSRLVRVSGRLIYLISAIGLAVLVAAAIY